MSGKKKVIESWDRWKVLLGLSLLGIVFLLDMFLVHRQYRIHVQEHPGALLRISGEREVTGELVRGRELAQDFWLEQGTVTGFALEFATYGRGSQGKAQVKFYRASDGSLLGQWILSGGEIEDNRARRFDLGSPVRVREGGERFRVEVRSLDGTPGNSFSLYRTKKDLYKRGTLTGEEGVSTDLALEVYHSDYAGVRVSFLLLALYTGAVYLLFCLFVLRIPGKIRQVPLERIVTVLVLLLGTGYMFVMPPHAAPDEPAHFGTAYAYTNRMLMQPAGDEAGYVYMRQEDMVYNEAQKNPTAYSYQLFWDEFLSMSGEGGKVTFGSRMLSGVWPLAYLPQIAGILIARSLHLGGVPLFMFTRCMSLLFYAGCVYHAVRRMPFAKGALALTALLPMSLELGASCSYDSMMLALTYLFAGQVWHCIYIKERMCWKDWGLLAGIAVLVVPLKIVYLPLFALCLLIPARKCPSVRHMWAGRACVLGGGLLSLLAVRLYSIVYYLTRTSFHAAKGEWQGISLQDVLAHPAMGLRLLAESLRSQGDLYLSTMVGGKLGWLDTEIPDYLVYGFWLLLFLSAVKVAREKQYIQTGARFLAVGSSVVTVLAIFGVFLLTWTAAGADHIDGVQGRYFLPLLPVLLPCLRNRRLVLHRDIEKQLLACAVILHLFVFWSAFQTNLLR